jgi:hypothetical protein
MFENRDGIEALAFDLKLSYQDKQGILERLAADDLIKKDHCCPVKH